MDVQPCSRCGSDEVVPDAEVRDYDASSYRPLSVVVPLASPSGGLIKKASESGELRARVCGGCGAVELFTTNADALLAAHRGGGS
jgi:hypothetical protein